MHEAGSGPQVDGKEQSHESWEGITQKDNSAASAGKSAMWPYLIQKALPAFCFQRLCLRPLRHAYIAAYAGCVTFEHPTLQLRVASCEG